MRAMFFVMIWVVCMGCEGSQGSNRDLDEVDEDSEILKDSGMIDSESESKIKDSEVQDSDSEVQDSDSEVESESCVFSEKGDYRCEDNSIQECLEDPNSSTIELIWQLVMECAQGSVCEERSSYPSAVCVPLGDCMVGQIQCSDDKSEFQECVYDEELGGGVWVTSNDCGSKDQVCDLRFKDRCVDPDWEYCTPNSAASKPKCVGDVIWTCEVDHWVVAKDCTEDKQSCGVEGKDVFCYDRCIYTCTSDKMCDFSGGNVMYGLGECMDDLVCCKK